MKAIGIIAMILLIIGGLNWGLVGLFNFNVIEKFLDFSIFARIIYVLVGLAALWKLYHIFGCCKCCRKDNKPL